MVFGEARWRSSGVTSAELNELIEKGLLWLKGDTARWDVHYAFFAHGFGQLRGEHVDEDNLHLFTPDDIIAAEVSATIDDRTQE